MHFVGGETAAHDRLNVFCSDEGGIATYKKTRNESLGLNYSTKLSPYLAAGFITARQVHHRVAMYEAIHGASPHTYWVAFELIVRDYMRFFAMKYSNRIFMAYGPAGKVPSSTTITVNLWDSINTSSIARERWLAWKNGTTGNPWFVVIASILIL